MGSLTAQTAPVDTHRLRVVPLWRGTEYGWAVTLDRQMVYGPCKSLTEAEAAKGILTDALTALGAVE